MKPTYVPRIRTRERTCRRHVRDARHLPGYIFYEHRVSRYHVTHNRVKIGL